MLKVSRVTYNATYYEKHKKKIIEKGKEKTLCGCGSYVSKYHKSRHCKSIKHIKWLKKNIL